MRATRIVCLMMAWVALFAAGCKKNAVDTMAFKSALNSYYANQQECLWTAPVKFPQQADTSKDEDTKTYDALTDAGLLTRKPEEKKRFLIGSKQVNDYDLSDQGRSSWTPDPSQPGYGNFCYGHRDVTSIDNSTLGSNADGAKTVAVAYHYKIADVADWANSAEMKTAYPKIAATLDSTPSDTATLVMTGDHWTYSK